MSARKKGQAKKAEPPTPLKAGEPTKPAEPKYTVKFLKAADKQFQALDPQIRKRVGKAIERLREDPKHHGCEMLNAADGMMRVRVGDWRVLYQIRDETLVVLVLRVLHRGDDYRGLQDLVEAMRRISEP